MKKYRGIILILGIFIGILIFQFVTNYNFRKEPPSSKWSKEVLIGSGKSKEYPKLIKNKDSNIVVFDDKNNIKIVKTDLLGKKLKETLIDTKNDFIKDINLVKDNTSLYLSWLSSKKGMSYIEVLQLDNEFNVKDRRKINGVISVNQIDEDCIILGYKDKIEVWDVVKNKHMYVKAEQPSFIQGISKNNKKMVVYMDKACNLNAVEIYKEKLSDTKLIIDTGKSDNISYENIAFSADDKDGYILIEQKVKNQYVGVRQVKFDLNFLSEAKVTSLYVNENQYINCIKGVSSNEGARFLGTMSRIFALKKEQENIVDFTIKDGKVIKTDYVTRLPQDTLKSDLDGDMAVFLSFKGQDEWNIYLTSEAENFKKVNNNSRSFEVKDTALVVLEGFAYSVAYVLVYALKWIIPALFLIGVMSFFDFTLKEKKKKTLYIAISTITVILKIYVILDVSYGPNYFGYLPNTISSKFLGAFLCLIIGVISYAIGYKKYKDDIEILPAFVFAPVMLIDTILTLMIFIPFLP